MISQPGESPGRREVEEIFKEYLYETRNARLLTIGKLGTGN
jgi:hypothetical protein